MGRHGQQIFFTARRFLSKNFCQQKLLIEASFYLLAARCLLAIMPFRRLAALLDKELKSDRVPQDIGIEIAEKVKWSIDCASRHLPIRLVCLPRGIAAYLMLRRRRVDIQLYYGISNQIDRLYAGHVWVQYGSFAIIGCEQLEQYTVLLTFPNNRVGRSASGDLKHPKKEETP